ncbi:MAG: hypothetical protein C5B49_02915 [Bdellovibrio sp.]|nr:MAG: hypothetical protein C5B49_02915 [Bdellovibrio sp.]
MKFVKSAQHMGTHHHQARFQLEGGLNLTISALEKNLFRLSVKRGEHFQWPRTWSIAWNDKFRRRDGCGMH